MQTPSNISGTEHRAGGNLAHENLAAAFLAASQRSVHEFNCNVWKTSLTLAAVQAQQAAVHAQLATAAAIHELATALQARPGREQNDNWRGNQ
jgi:hypothetical protein